MQEPKPETRSWAEPSHQTTLSHQQWGCWGFLPGGPQGSSCPGKNSACVPTPDPRDPSPPSPSLGPAPGKSPQEQSCGFVSEGTETGAAEMFWKMQAFEPRSTSGPSATQSTCPLRTWGDRGLGGLGSGGAPDIPPKRAGGERGRKRCREREPPEPETSGGEKGLVGADGAHSPGLRPSLPHSCSVHAGPRLTRKAIGQARLPALLPSCCAPKGPPRPNLTLACNRPVSHPPPAETLSVPFQCHLPLDVLVQPQKWIPILPTFQTRKLRLRDFEVTPCSEMEPGFGWGTQGRAGPLDGDTPGPSPHCVSAPLTDPDPGKQVRSPECVPGWWAVPGW